MTLKKGKWIWYPDDEIFMLYKKVMTRRTYRGSRISPFWKTEFWYDSVTFSKTISLSVPQKFRVLSDGDILIHIDNAIISSRHEELEFPSGMHELTITCYNKAEMPCIRVDGESTQLLSDGTWLVNPGNGIFVNAVSRKFYGQAKSPNKFMLPMQSSVFCNSERIGKGILYDSETEIFATPVLEDVNGTGFLHIYYGESREEALDTENCELLDDIYISGHKKKIQFDEARAFRYLYIVRDEGVSYGNVYLRSEKYPVERKSCFRCSDDLLNQIYETSYYTMELTSREFFLDGLKRDRWVWSGDSYQSINMCFYSYFDKEIIKRTLIALGGKFNVDMHINTIMEYTFYWVLAIYDYYYYTGDFAFLQSIYPKVTEHIAFCLKHTDENGFMPSRANVWVFVDWADMDKRGTLCVEQILLCQALYRTAEMGRILGSDNAKFLQGKAENLRKNIFRWFWADKEFGFVHNLIDGRRTQKMTRYAGIFAVLFGLLDKEGKQTVSENVLLNDSIQAITTPYMKFYELAALFECGEGEIVLKYLREYWGGMLSLGATTFWEAYDAKEQEHYSMYGRKYGKSLCHAWGAAPLLFFGRYIAGIRPSAAGYEEFEARPNLCGLEWFETEIPTNGGKIHMYCDRKGVSIESSRIGGIVYMKDKRHKILPNKKYFIEW